MHIVNDLTSNTKYFNTLITDVRIGDWYLFLDRDGTINERLMDEYVTNWSEFKWIEGALNSLHTFSKYFTKIFIVTNQQGIGKGLMTDQNLEAIHTEMCKEIKNANARIDGIKYCPKLREDSTNRRKPKSALALELKEEFPEINFKKSIMIGDSQSDIDFGKSLGMITISLVKDLKDYSYYYPSMFNFSKQFEFCDRK